MRGSLCLPILPFLFLLLLFPAIATHYSPWFTATLAPGTHNNNNYNVTAYIVGGGIPNYMDTWVSRPLFIIDNYNSSAGPSSPEAPEAVTGASGAKSLSFPLKGECLYVATERCVLAVSTESGLKVRAIAGSCAEQGRRNGPLMFARFMSLSAISSLMDEGRFFIGLLDSSPAKTSLLLADSWAVSEICSVDPSTFDLSISAVPRGTMSNNLYSEEDGFKDIAILVLAPFSAKLILGRNDDGDGEKVMFGSSLLWKTYTIISLNSSSSLFYPDNNNSAANPEIHGEFTACLLQTTANGVDGAPTYTAYLVDADGALWIMAVGSTTGNNRQLKQTTNIYKKHILEWNGGVDFGFVFISRLLWRVCDALGAPFMCVVGVDTLNSRFIDVYSGGGGHGHDRGNSSIDNNNNACNFPWQSSGICDLGHVWMGQENICAPSPPGGYVDMSLATWIPCPVGTYNPLPMAMSLLACSRCGPGSIAPFLGSVVCSACNDTHPLQSTSGSECLAACLAVDADTWICKSCPPGYEPTTTTTTTTEQDPCQICSDNYYSPSLDQPCLPCPPNMTSIKGATYCSVQCPPETCSPDGLSSCLSPPTSSAFMVYTVADFKNLGDSRFASMAVCPNGTIFLGNDRGHLTIFHGEGSIVSVDMAYIGMKTLNAMALSWDAGRLFVADTLEGLIVDVSDTGGQMEILISKSSKNNNNIMPLSLCWVSDEGLYVVDAENGGLWLFLFTANGSAANDHRQPVHIQNVSRQGLVFVTPHESGHGVVYLVQGSENEEVLYSIWHVVSMPPSHRSILLSQVFRDNATASSLIHPWISRWINGKTAVCIIGGDIALVSDYSDGFTVASANNYGNDDDDEITRAANNIIIAPTAASLKIPRRNHSDNNYFYGAGDDDNLLFLLDVFSIKVIFSRSCECAPNFYKTKTLTAQACVPCPPHTYSMAGAEGCSVCPSGEYVGPYGDCTECPLTLWWDDFLSSMYSPCGKMRGTLSSTLQGGSLTLHEAQNIANQNSYASLVDEDLDIISNAAILLTGTGDNLAIPPPDIWLKSDLLGRLWSFQSRVTSKPFDPQGIAVLNHPGIWSLCSQVALPGEPCTCRYGALQLGYNTKQNGWEQARKEAVTEDLPGFSFSSVFVLRPDDNHTTAPILIKNGGGGGGGGSILLVPHFPIGDTGICLMGWPAQFNCSDPHYFWEFPTEGYPGGACRPCPVNTIAPTQSSVKCKPITAHNPLCKPGTFKAIIMHETFSYACGLCEGDTYSSTYGAIRCLQKRVLSCPQGFYVKDGGHTSENVCVACVPCGESSIMIPFWTDPCPGDTRIKPYVCVAWLQSISGFSVQVLNLEKTPTLRYIPCTGLPPFSVWASGSRRDICFFSCKFGVNEAVVQEYAFYWRLLSPGGQDDLWSGGGTVADKNLFPHSSFSQQSLAGTSAMNAVCAPCNTSLCPEGLWRPLWADGCGPPCHISPSLCQGRADGCVSICDVPENAAIWSYNTVDLDGRPVCLWRCNIGFVKTGEICSECSASLCQPGESYIGNSQCSPEMSLAQICLPCSATVMGGVLNVAAANRGKCSYTCLKDYYYPNPDPSIFLRPQMSCIRCADTVTRCPAGYSVTCAVSPCKLCETATKTLLLSGKATMAPTSDSICNVQCMSGFHTVNILDRTVLSDKEIILAHDPSKIACEECSRRPYIPCPVLSCGPGYQIVILQGVGMCAPCKTSLEMGCVEGTYAPPCPGGRVTQNIGCLTCPMYDLLVAAAIESGDSVPDTWPTRVFVPFSSSYYSSQLLLNVIATNTSKKTAGGLDDHHCLTVCVHGSVQVKTSASTISKCVACSVLLPTPPKNAPYSGYYSAWNASDGVRWWPVEFDPPHLQRRQLDSKGNLREESRAGLCWPCPFSTAASVSYGRYDPCFYYRHPSTANGNNNYLYSLASSDVLNTGDDPSERAQFTWVLTNNNHSRRRNRFLLSSVAFSQYTASTSSSSSIKKPNANSSQVAAAELFCREGQYPAPPLASWCAVCPENYYCTGGKTQPVRCGPFRYATMGSASLENCSCRPGFVSFSSSCVLEVSKLDFPCPLGFFKETAKSSRSVSMCFPCPAGTRESNGRCHDCPLQSTSKEASRVCTCAATVDNLTKADHENAVIDMTPTTDACPSEACPQGSSLDFADSICKSCSHKMAVSIPSVFPLTCSCGPGSYYSSVPGSPSSIQCLPCPRGRFSQFAGDAPCTPCPDGTITLLEGSTTLAACVKSDILDPDVVVVRGNHSNNATFIKV